MVDFFERYPHLYSELNLGNDRTQAFVRLSYTFNHAEDTERLLDKMKALIIPESASEAFENVFKQVEQRRNLLAVISSDKYVRGDTNFNIFDEDGKFRKHPFFGIDEVVNEILATTPHLKASLDEIRGYFEGFSDIQKRTEYIRSIFNDDFTEIILADDTRVGYKTYENGLLIWKGRYPDREGQSFHRWDAVAGHFEAMRLLGMLHSVIKPLPSQNGQLQLITESAGRDNTAFSFSQELIDAALTRGSGVSEGKLRIYEQYQKSLSKSENISFLKKEYGIGGSSSAVPYTGVGEDHSGKGIELRLGYDEGSPRQMLTWNYVEKRIGELIKADIFFKRTVKAHKPVTSVDTATEALAVSMGEKAEVDMDYMCELTGKSEQEIYDELQGVIFLNPLYENNRYSEQKYLTADEYLSGNVREKLETAQKSAAVNPDTYSINVQALERVQPEPLTASEISVRLGATWIPPEIIQQFVFEFLGTPRYAQWKMQLHYSPYTSEWSIENKSYDNTNIKAYRTYGTDRINAYRIIEETLNLKDVRIFDYVEDEFGKRKPVLNKKETTIALQKQELIKEGFREWIWKDPQRRERLCKIYNEKFNSTRPREYDGSHITFSGMNPEIELREHQKNAVAHILYGGNTLLAHAVGAGKTFEMTAAAMESKRLGLCSKSLFVVPNHLTEQWAAEFLQLYPAANILVATKKDFETANRKRFCGRIATGDYDAIIIGHSQFEKIPMSIERQRALLEQQIDEITDGIAELKENRGDNFSIKQLEKTRKSIKVKLQKLNDQTRKDDVVTFEELGVDRLFIDESHYYKNLYLYTKMRNVGGIAQTEAQKSSDLFMKCRYLDEITGGRGTVFATGTPISNSMVELYTIQRYLQYETLVENGLQHFDAWASTFGETVTAYELKPEGTGYRTKTRFAKFYNLPELMAMFKQVADIKTADTLNLPTPTPHYHNVAVKPSEMQKTMVADLAERAEKVRGGNVDPSVDNMLKITNDGRKLALDQRMINPMLPDNEGSKINACVDNIFTIWQDNTDKKSAQLG